MKNEKIIKKFNCKIEELPIICRFGLSIARRDLGDFTAFSPMFSVDYFNGFETKIIAVDELVSPKTETEEMKKITKRLYSTIDGLVEPLNKVRGYLQLAGSTVGMSDKDFGISLLAQKVRGRDAEGVRQNLLLVNTNIQTYLSELTAVGLNSEIVSILSDSIAPITEDNQQQFEIATKRKETVSENIGKLNELYLQLMEFLKVGNIIYKTSNPVKASEYLFTNLIKKVRVVPIATAKNKA